MIIFDLFKALKAGEEISNPASWKSGTMLLTCVGVIVAQAFKIFAPDYNIEQDLIDTITQSIYNGLIAINLFMTKATSKKV
jgi:hypothetical protein